MANITDEMLVAYADGELNDAERRMVESALPTDSDLRNRVHQFETTRRLLRTHLRSITTEPAPDHLVRLVLSNGTNPQARARSRGFGRLAMPAAAALFGIAIGSVVSWLATTATTSPPEELILAKSVQRTLSQALTDQPDGARLSWDDPEGGQRGDIALKASFRTSAGYCRTYEVAPSGTAVSVSGVACRTEGGWQTRVAVAGPATNEFSPASGATKPIDAFLDNIDAEDPLSPAEVARRIGGGWR